MKGGRGMLDKGDSEVRGREGHLSRSLTLLSSRDLRLQLTEGADSLLRISSIADVSEPLRNAVNID